MRSSLLALMCAAGIAPCSSPASSGGAGDGASGSSGASSGGSGIAADGFIAATVGPGASSPPSVCNLASVQSWVDVGTPVAGKPTTVQDGATSGGSAVHVACTVRPSGSGFDVSLSITQEGLSGGSVMITSPPGQGAVTLNGGQGLTGGFQSNSNGSYQQTDCTLTFTYSGSPVPDQPPIASGRIWGHLSCPSAQIPGQTMQCDAEADFLFEQCAE